MKGICERCGKEYTADETYDEWIGRDVVQTHLCHACFEADRDALVQAMGVTVKPRMGHGRLNPHGIEVDI